MNKKILHLALPNIIANISTPLLSSVDTAILGHFTEVYYLGALSLAGVVFNFVYWGFAFLRMGTTGLTAQAFGNRDNHEALLILARTLLIAVCCGIALIFAQTLIAKIGFHLLHGEPEVEKYAQEYFYIRIYAAPATLGLFAFHGWFLGMQNSRYPLYLAIIVNVLNIGLNFLFIFRFHMKSDGVAYGTLIAQYTGLIAAIVLYFKKYHSQLFVNIKGRIFEKEALKKIFGVNFDIFTRTLCLIFVFSYFTAKSAESGNSILAANTILFQLILILSFCVDGFALTVLRLRRRV